jgi:hypothetical protein
VAATAAAGVLLTVTGIVGALCYAAWAIADRTIAGRPTASPAVVAQPAVAAPTQA